MRLGKNEKKILSSLTTDEWTSPSVYLGEYGSCISRNAGGMGAAAQRLVFDKGLAEFRYRVMTSNERLLLMKKLKPGREASEFNAAMRLTAKGAEVLGLMEVV